MKRTAIAVLGIALALMWIAGTIDSPLVSKMRSLVSRSVGEAMAAVGGTPEADYAYVIDAATGKELEAKNATRRAYPASTTKILTVLLALELGAPSEIVTVGNEVQPEDPEESRAGLRPGQRLSLYDLVEAAVLPSGNDAARAIAVHIGRKSAGKPNLDADQAQREFARLMNKRAKQAGATGSNFVNPTGLHDRNHYTTARDMALIAREAMNNKLFRQAVSATEYTIRSDGPGRAAGMPLVNTNQLLQQGGPNYFKGATGIKTGFTDQAGYCLVASATDEAGRTVIAVVLHSTSSGVYPDAAGLLNRGFAKLEASSK